VAKTPWALRDSNPDLLVVTLAHVTRFTIYEIVAMWTS